MGKFSESAKKSVGGSEVIAGKEKIDMDTLIAAYKNGITITGADLVTTTENDEKKQFAVCTFAEEPTKYFSAGMSLTQVVVNWFKDFDLEDGVQLSKQLKEEGGVKVKFVKKKTKSGRTFTEVEVL